MTRDRGRVVAGAVAGALIASLIAVASGSDPAAHPRAASASVDPVGCELIGPHNDELIYACPTTSSTPDSTPDTATTAPAATSTTVAATSAPTTATTSAPTTAAPTTAAPTTAPATTAPSTPGTFTESFGGNLSGWFLAHGRPQTGDNCVPVGGCPTTLSISGGKLVIVNGEQDYGDATARSLTKYDLTNGGTVSLDISDDGGGNRLIGSAYVMFSAGPEDAKHQHTLSVRPLPDGPYCKPDGTIGCVPSEGTVTMWLMDNCRVQHGPPIVVRYRSMVEQQGTCAADPNPNAPGNQIIDGKLRLVYTPGNLSIRNGANQQIVAYSVTLPPVGYLTLGVHNHASMKYSAGGTQRAVTGTFDNVSYPTSSGATTTTTSPPTSSTAAATTTTAAPTTTAPATTAPATTVPSGSGFSTAFTSSNDLALFDMQLHTANQVGGQATNIADTFVGEHDLMCGGPTTHRTVHAGQSAPSFLDVSSSELVWYCQPGNDPANGHLMTALDTTGIADISFSPKQSFTDVKSVCWSQNMNDLGGAKWVNVFVVPVSDVAAHGGNLNYLSEQGRPFDNSPNRQLVPANSFHWTWLRGSTFAYQGVVKTMDFWQSGDIGGDFAGYNLDPAPRFQVCLDNVTGNMVIHRPDGSIDTYPLGASFPTGQVRVIFQDSSYNPTKHDGFVDHLTWHWDNITIAT